MGNASAAEIARLPQAGPAHRFLSDIAVAAAYPTERQANDYLRNVIKRPPRARATACGHGRCAHVPATATFTVIPQTLSAGATPSATRTCPSAGIRFPGSRTSPRPDGRSRDRRTSSAAAGRVRAARGCRRHDQSAAVRRRRHGQYKQRQAQDAAAQEGILWGRVACRHRDVLRCHRNRILVERCGGARNDSAIAALSSKPRHRRLPSGLLAQGVRASRRAPVPRAMRRWRFPLFSLLPVAAARRGNRATGSTIPVSSRWCDTGGDPRLLRPRRTQP